MSEEKIDIKKLTVSKALELFLQGKFSKKELKDAFDIDDLFKSLSYKELEDLLYSQRKNVSIYPKELRIKSGDILYQYGRNISAGQLMNFASKGYVSEADVLKALKKNEVLLALAYVTKKEEQEEEKEEKSVKKQDEDSEEEIVDEKEKTPKIDIKPLEEIELDTVEAPVVSTTEEIAEEPVLTEKDLLSKDDVKAFFSADKLIKMFFARKMTREFTEVYEDVFKSDQSYREVTSKEIIKELQEIFADNLQALYIIIMRLHFRGMILSQDAQAAIKAEFFTDKCFEVCDEYDVLDRDGNIIYSYKKDDKKKKIDGNIDLLPEAEAIIEPDILVPESDGEEKNLSSDNVDEEPMEEYPILAPITREELYDEYRDENVDGTILGMIFSDEEIIEMYKNNKASVKIFTLLSTEKRKQEILKAYENSYMSLEDLMDLYFLYDGISVETLKDIIKELPQKVSITRFISYDTNYRKIYELYKNKLIDFSILYLLRCQEFISEQEYNEIRLLVNKDEFYESIEASVFYTSKPETEESLPNQIEISDTERVLLSKVMGISDEEIEKISVIYSKGISGEATLLDGYHIISDKRDGLVIFGKFDYSSPIYVMTYEEAAYYLRSKDGIDQYYIYDDLLFCERLANNEQIRVVEHDENMAKTIVQAMCELSEEARSRYIDDEQYMQEVLEYIKTIDENYVEMIKESNNNM